MQRSTPERVVEPSLFCQSLLDLRVVLNSDAPLTSPATKALQLRVEMDACGSSTQIRLDWSRLHFINLHFSFLGSVTLDSDIVSI